MKTADSRRRRNVSASGRALFYRSIRRRALVQANVSSVIVIIAKVVAPKPPQMMFVQRNDVIEQFAAHASHASFGGGVLPRTADTCSHWLEITRLQEGQRLVAKFGIMVEQNVSIRTREWKGFTQLLHDPITGRMKRSIEVPESGGCHVRL
jgi:hypothetical protein